VRHVNQRSKNLKSIQKEREADMELLNLKTETGKELGYLLVRLSTLSAERTSDRAGLRRSLERRIDSIVCRATGKPEPQPVAESKPISFEEAKARTEVLVAELSEVKPHGNRRA
jgi:hypothetical protein